jgi:hypothetical protein
MRYIYLTRKSGQFPFESGADLYCEVQGQWVHASKVSGESLRKAMENGSFKAMEDKKGRPMPILNLADAQQRLIAARLGLTYAGKKADSLREIDEALKRLQQIMDQIELDELTSLLNRLEATERQMKQLEEEKQIEEIAEKAKPVSMKEVTTDLSRAFRKKEQGLDVAMLSRIAEASQLIASSQNFFADPKLFAKIKRLLNNALQG